MYEPQYSRDETWYKSDQAMDTSTSTDSQVVKNTITSDPMVPGGVMEMHSILYNGSATIPFTGISTIDGVQVT